MRPVTQRVSGQRVLQPDDGHDVASLRLLDVDAIVCMNLVQARHPLHATRGRVQNHVAPTQTPAVDPNEHHARMLVAHDLERQGRQRRVRIRRWPTLGGRHIPRARQEVDHGVEQRLHATVAIGRATQDRDEGLRQHTLVDAAAQGFD